MNYVSLERRWPFPTRPCPRPFEFVEAMRRAGRRAIWRLREPPVPRTTSPSQNPGRTCAGFPKGPEIQINCSMDRIAPAVGKDQRFSVAADRQVAVIARRIDDRTEIGWLRPFGAVPVTVIIVQAAVATAAIARKIQALTVARQH